MKKKKKKKKKKKQKKMTAIGMLTIGDFAEFNAVSVDVIIMIKTH